nr:MAG TPA: hypothetical protein [Caudoviricetes sp.]
MSASICFLLTLSSSSFIKFYGYSSNYFSTELYLICKEL